MQPYLSLNMNQMPREEQPLNTQNIKKDRAKNNWKKVRTVIKMYNQNDKDKKSIDFIQQIRRKQNQRFHLNLFQKQQHHINEDQKYQFISRLKNQKTKNSFLVDNCQIIKTINKCYILKQTLFEKLQEYSQNNTNQKKIQSKLNKIQQFLQLNILTYRPLPILDYLLGKYSGNGLIDTTGIWVWEAEQILSYFLIVSFKKYGPQHENFSVLQLGAGCSGLAALTYAKMLQIKLIYLKFLSQQCHQDYLSTEFQKWFNKLTNQPQKYSLNVDISDGKQENIIYLQKNIEQNFNNQISRANIKLRGFHYLWGNSFTKENDTSNKIDLKQQEGEKEIIKFDLILAADCLFFENYHDQLLKSLNDLLLQDKGRCLFVNPRRGNSFSNFSRKLKIWNQQQKNEYQFLIEIIQFDDMNYKKLMEKTRSNSNFNADTDQFLFTQIRKIKRKKRNEQKIKQYQKRSQI